MLLLIRYAINLSEPTLLLGDRLKSFRWAHLAKGAHFEFPRLPPLAFFRRRLKLEGTVVRRRVQLQG